MSQNELIPVVSYERISADGARDAHGVADQFKINQRTAKTHGFKIVHRFTDNDKSAAKASVVRDDFEAMLKVLRAGHLPDGTPVRGAVVVADDRLARRPGDYERFVDAFTLRDGNLFADAKGMKDLYSEDVESMGLFGVVISKMEVRKMQRRMRNNHRSRAERGVPVGGTRPFGWQADRISLDPVEAPLLREAAGAFLRGRSLHTLCIEWQTQGVKTSLGNDWTMRSLKIALWNPRICGWRRLNGEIVRDEAGDPILGQWEPIITPEQWLAIDAVFTERKGMSVGNKGQILGPLPSDYREPKFLLTGFLRCGKTKSSGEVCNATLRANRHKGTAHHLYTCPASSAGGCGGIGRRGDLVDEYITEAVLATLEKRQAVAKTVEPWQGAAKLERMINKRSKLVTAWQADTLSDDAFFAATKTIEAQIKELNAEKARHALTAQRVLATTADVRERWKSSDMMQKRAVISEALHAVIVYPSGPGRRPFNPDLLVPVWR